MSQLQGSSVSTRIGFEASFGTPATVMHEIPFAPTLNVNTTQELQESTVMTGTRSASQGFLGFKDGAGSLTVPVESKAFGLWLKAFFNVPTTVDNGDGTYTHTFVVNDVNIPSLTVEQAHLDKANTFYRHVGFKANNLSLSLGGDDELLATIELVGKDSTKETTEVAVPSTTYKTGTKFQKFNNLISGLTGADDVRTYTIDYTNNLDGSSYTVNNGSARNDIPTGMSGVTGTIEANFTGEALASSSESFATETIVSTLTQGTDILKITTNEININKQVGQEIASPQGILANYDYVAFHKDGATASSIIVELTNDIASYA